MTSAMPLSTPRTSQIFRALLQADAFVLAKNRRSLILSIMLPMIILISTNNPNAGQRLGGALVIVALAVTYGLMSTSMLGYALSVARDRESGVFQRLRVTPAPTWTIIASRLTIQMLANFIISLMVVVVGSSIHHVSLTISQYTLVLAISIVGSAVFLSIGQAIVGLIKSSDTVNATGRIVFIALILLGMFGLTGTLGGALEFCARWSPVGTVMTLFAGVLDLRRWTGHDSFSLLICVLYIAIFTGIGIRWFRWESQ